MADYSLDGIIEEINNSILKFKQNKNAENKNNLSLIVQDGFEFINKNKSFAPDNKNDKFSKKVREELFPLVIEANSLLPINKKYNIDSSDYPYNQTEFIQYLPKSYLAYLPKKDIKNVKVKEVFSGKVEYPISPYNPHLNKVFEDIVSRDDLRPIMKGIDFEDNMATGTDAHVLLHIVGKKEGDWSNGVYALRKNLEKEYKDLTKVGGNLKETEQQYLKSKAKLDGKFPNYKVLVNINQMNEFTTINCQIMVDALSTLISNRITDSFTNSIEIKVGDKGAYFNANYLLKLFKSWIELGVKEIKWLKTDIDDFYSKAFLFVKSDEIINEYANQNDITYSLIMPLMRNNDIEQSSIEIIDYNNIDVVVGDSPAYRMSSGTYVKETKENPPTSNLEALISDLEMSMEFMSAKDKKNARELISDLKMAMEFSDEIVVEAVKKQDDKEVSKIPTSFEYDGEELASDSAYLMTEQEYKDKVVPIIKDYLKFVRKNNIFLKSVGYSSNSIAFYTEEDYRSDKKHLIKTKTYSSDYYTEEENFNIQLGRLFTKEFNEKFYNMTTPEEIIKENKEYQNKLSKFFTEEQKIKGDSGIQKTNKGNVRYAIDKDIYRKLLDANKISVERLNEIADSVGIKLPKKAYDIRTQVNMELQKDRGKLLSKLSQNNQEQIETIEQTILDKLKPIDEEIYVNEMNRYDTLLSEQIGKAYYTEDEHYNTMPILLEELWLIIPIYNQLLQIEPTGKTRKGEYETRREIEIVDVPEYKVIGLKDDFNKTLSKFVADYVLSLKVKLFNAIYKDWAYLTSPMKSIDFVELKVDSQGYQGIFKIVFKNGAIVYYQTNSIGAGGYNIQRYHFRYLTKFDLQKSKDKDGNAFKSKYDIFNMN